MKDEQTEIDTLFKERLYNMESDVQVDAWNKISAKIDASTLSNTSASKVVAKAWMYYAAASALVIVVTAVWIGTKKSTAEIPVSTKNAAQEISQEVKHTAETTVLNSNAEQQSAQTVKPLETKKLIKISALEDRKETALPDGSIVLLNRNSSISYSADYMSDYTVYVTGEVYFDLTSEKSKAIHIITPAAKIDAGQAAFIVSTKNKNMYEEIVVSSGKVSCKSIVANQDRMLILAGNKAVVGSSGKLKEEPISDINYKDWVTQKIVFSDTQLDAVFTTLEEYYNVSLTTDNAEILNCRFTGTFERNNIDEVLRVLSVSFDLSFNQNNKKYILSGNGCK